MDGGISQPNRRRTPAGKQSDRRQRLHLQRTVRSTRTKAYSAFLDRVALNTWFTSRARVTPAVGGRYSNADHDEGRFLVLDPGRRIRFTWDNPKHCPGTVIDIMLVNAGSGRVTIRLSHLRLATRKDREEMKGGWSWAMDSLRSYLETGKGIAHDAWLASKAG